jgi:glucose-1-phosphate adenylyltransferase
VKIQLDYDVTCVIMGGGAGTRLYPLTRERAKPAVPLGGKYRLIDIPISNCLNSGLPRMFILTQFNSTSLHRHINQTYRFDRFSLGFVEILAAQQTPQLPDEYSWYQGTADAVRKNLVRLKDAGGRDVLILSGDQIYQMDFKELMEAHRGETTSIPNEVTITALLVPYDRINQLGILRIDETGRVVEFVEKPRGDQESVRGLEAPRRLLENYNLPPDSGPWFLANMGIYAFQLDVLEEALRGEGADFGREVLPRLLDRFQVRAHLFHGYWEDIGTIPSFHQVNIELAGPTPRFNFYSQVKPIYTRARLLPASRIREATLVHSLVAEGCLIEGATIDRSLIGIRSVIKQGAVIRNTYIMGADYFESDEERRTNRAHSAPDIGIGPGTTIENAIIDKNARVGAGVTIKNLEGHQNFEDGKVIIRDGIVVVPRMAVIPDGYRV